MAPQLKNLYSISKQITFIHDQERLGLSRIAALTERISIDAWFDTHKTHLNWVPEPITLP